MNSVGPTQWSEAERLTAFHEAGHALMAHLCGQQITEVEIIGDTDHTGSVHSLSFPRGAHEADGQDLAGEAIEMRLKCILAGMVAEAMVTGRSGWDEACEDLDLAVHLAMPLVDDCERVLPFLEEIRLQVERDLSDRWETVNRLVEELLQRKTMPGAEVRRILESAG